MKNHRRQYLISPNFQIKFIGHFLAVVFLTCSLIYTAYAYFFHTMVEIGTSRGLPSDHIYFALISDQESQMNSILMVVFLILGLFFTAYGVLFSHKIAGPMYRLKTYFENLNNPEAEKSPLSFRKGDYFQEVVEPINKYLENK